MAFVNRDHSGEFVGELSDPMPVAWCETGRGAAGRPRLRTAGSAG